MRPGPSAALFLSGADEGEPEDEGAGASRPPRGGLTPWFPSFPFLLPPLSCPRRGTVTLPAVSPTRPPTPFNRPAIVILYKRSEKKRDKGDEIDQMKRS